jgi:hypothetical protein
MATKKSETDKKSKFVSLEIKRKTFDKLFKIYSTEEKKRILAGEKTVEFDDFLTKKLEEITQKSEKNDEK